jgi:hypothetical protein
MLNCSTLGRPQSTKEMDHDALCYRDVLDAHTKKFEKLKKKVQKRNYDWVMMITS